jgi:signal transduction histidine kinase
VFRHLRCDFRTSLIALLYPVLWVATHEFAVGLNVAPGVSIWYPPAGLTFAFLLLLPRFWPLAYLGIGVVVWWSPYATASLGMLLSWLIPPTGYVLGVGLLRRSIDGKLDLRRQAHIHRFIVASLLVPASVAAMDVLNFCIDGAIPWANFGAMLARFFIGDALGIVTLTPPLLLLNGSWREGMAGKSKRRLFVGLVAVGAILYLEVTGLLLGQDQGRLSYFVMLPVAWNAVAFGIVGAAASTLLANVSITAATIIAPSEHILAGAPYFMLSIGYLSLILAGAVEDREGALRKLRQQDRALDKAYRHFTTYETASKLAHEIRQPLAAASTYAQALNTMATKGSIDTAELPQVTERLEREVQRVREIIAANQAQHDQAVGKRELLSLSKIIGDVAPLLRQICEDSGVQPHFEIDGCVAQVLGDRATLQQLAVNLVRNACEAMATASHKALHLDLSQTDGKISLRVRDSGPGFSEDLLRSGHALFASAKPSGSGFGLPIARAILTAHGGDLDIANNDEGGACVTCWLPVAS